MRKIWWLVGFMSACSSLPKKQDVVLPATVESLFTTCSTGDGALNLQVYDQGILKGSGDLEWIAEFERGWRSQLISPVGQTLAKVSFDAGDQKFFISGGLADKVPSLAVDEGFLSLDGYFVGITPSEIPCFLKFRLPRNWLQSLYTYKSNNRGLKLGFYERRRRITTTVTGTQPELITKICSKIVWTTFLGMIERDLTVCSDLTGSKTGSLQGVEDFSVKWVNIEE